MLMLGSSTFLEDEDEEDSESQDFFLNWFIKKNVRPFYQRVI